MTDKQLIQNIVADYYKQRSIESQCMVCTDSGLGMCELHQADERTEVYRQAKDEPIEPIDTYIYPDGGH